MWSGGITIEWLVVLITGSLALLLALRRGNDKGRFPPGPFAWPLIGHLPLFAHLPHQALASLSAKYGPVIGLRLGHQLGVVVSNPTFAKEILVTHDKALANRPPYEFGSSLMFGCHNDIIMNSYSPQWRKLRKLCNLELFTAKRLRDLEYVRNQEIHTLLQSIREESSRGTHIVNIGKCIGHMTTTIIMRLICSDVYSGQSKEVENLHMLVREFEAEAVPTIGDCIPFLKWADFARKRRMRHIQARIDKVLTAILVECQSSMQTGKAAGPYENLVQALLSKLHVNDENNEGLSMEEIKSVMLDMVLGGIHTTAVTLEWIMAELLRNPHCMDPLQKEIGSVLSMNGKSQQYVTDADTARLSYLKCVVKEAFRLHPVFPLSIPRIASVECKVQSYVIPAETQVFVNIWAIGRDEKVWEEAEKFKPERFEGKEVDVRGQHFELLPFGAGRRICIGLPLGLSIVEVTLANLLHHFNWELPPGEITIDMHEKTGMSLCKATPVFALPKPRLLLL